MKTSRLLPVYLLLILFSPIKMLNAQVSCTVEELVDITVWKDSECEAVQSYSNFVSLTVNRLNLANGTLKWQFRQDTVNGVWQDVNAGWSGQGSEEIFHSFFSTADNGQYRCVFRENSTQCRDVEKVYVKVKQRPDISISVDSVTCEGLYLGAADANNPTASNYSYCWEPDFGSSPPSCYSTDKAFLFTPVGCMMVVGTVSVIVTNNEGCEMFTFTSGLCNAEKLDVYAELNTISTEFCAKDAKIELFRQSILPLQPGWQYQWKKNGVDIAGAIHTSFIPYSSGTYSCVITNNNGCTQVSNPISVTVYPLPQATLNPGSSQEICIGDSLLLSVSGSSSYSYQWYKGNQPLNFTNDSLYASLAGSYKVLVTGTNGCTRFTNALKLSKYKTSVTALGPVVFCQGDSVVLQSNTLNTASWQWQLNNANIPGATGPSYVAKASGLYRVKGTSNAACISFSNKVDVSVSCREAAPPEESALRISPVPSSHRISLMLPALPDYSLLEILSATGQRVYRLPLAKNSSSATFDLDIREFPVGIYFLRISGEDVSLQGKFIRE
ncbi:MAG: T9SS type A sorting domain-containing protein [Bacteroidia bacterium]|nr:T9SS type A sorting domain-containing protein [Bacteroidia bacterium]